MTEDEAPAVGKPADHGKFQLPLLEDAACVVLAALAQHHEHALLALREHDLVGRHPALALGHEIEVEVGAQPALARHLEGRRGKAGGAHVLDGDDGVGGHQLEARLDQQLLGEGIADLHRGPLRIDGIADRRRCHGGPVDAVAPGAGSHVHHWVANAFGARSEHAVLRGDSHGHGVHQDVAVVSRIKAARAADRGHTDAVAVPADARHDAAHQMAGAGMAGTTEPERVEVGYRPRAHGEYIAQDAADAGCRALVRLDVGGVVVALHLEDGDAAAADVDDPGVFSRSADHPRCFRWQLAQPLLRALVGAVLAPHHRKDAEFGDIGLAAKNLGGPRVLLGREAEVPGERGVAGRRLGPGAQAASARVRPPKNGRPSVPPRRASARRSGWGMSPRMRPVLSVTPAIWRAEPLGLCASAVSPRGPE